MEENDSQGALHAVRVVLMCAGICQVVVVHVNILFMFQVAALANRAVAIPSSSSEVHSERFGSL